MDGDVCGDAITYVIVDQQTQEEVAIVATCDREPDHPRDFHAQFMAGQNGETVATLYWEAGRASLRVVES